MKQASSTKKTKSMRFLKFAFSSAILLTSSIGTSFAATGDIIYQNCASGGCSGAGSSTGWIRTVESSGCYSGQCLKLVGTKNTNPNSPGYGAGNTSISTHVSGYKEVTISTWIKLSEDPQTMSGCNLKVDRLYVGGSAYWGPALIGNLAGKDLRMGGIIGTIRPASWFKMTTSSDNLSYPTYNGDGTYYSGKGSWQGSITSGGPTGFGPQWVHLTKWIKLPSTPTSSDGATKYWIGNQLAVDIYNAKYMSPKDTTISNITFFPSSEATEPFEHWMDEMVVYEGYVPPTGASSSSSSSGGTSTTTSTSTTKASPSTPVGFREE